MRMQDVARRLGISAMTVSRALKADSSVAPDTRAAILKAIEELGYVPNLIAGSLSSARSGFAAVLVPSLNNPHFSETVLSLGATLETLGMQLLIGSTDYDRNKEAELVRALLARKPEAIILTSDGHNAAVPRMLAKARIPVIEIWDLPAEPIQHVVGFSNREAMRQLVAVLLGQGFRRMTYLGETDDENTRGAARRSGYCDAMLAQGLEPRLCSIGKPPANMSDGETGLNTVLAQFPDTELVACVSDPLAFGIIAACQRRGISVPGELAVSGFGDFEIARIGVPDITTVRIDAQWIGRKTGEIVMASIGRDAGHHKEPHIHNNVATEPCLRQSTGRLF
jgi:LacI family gluconate utilization system Gnt-I transcriptional repressor